MQTIFLSYAHGDNEKPSEKLDGWVTYFDRTLAIELRERGLRNVKLWRDRRDFEPMGVVGDTLAEAVRGADLFLAVLSPLYPLQDYCRFELSQFFTGHGSNVAGGSVLIVLKRPLQDDQYPPEIRDMGYLPFFEIDRESNDPTPFFGGFGADISPRYWETIRKAGTLIEKRLTELTGQKNAAAQTSDATGPVVYLAAAGSDLAAQHWGIRAELESQGCRIVPKEPWPGDPAAATAYLREALAEADFSIHLLGQQPGRSIASKLENLSALQLDLAAAREGESFRRLIWIAPDLPATAQQELIASLDSGQRLGPHDELVRAGLESFKEVVHEELKRHAADAAAAPRLYLICAQADEAGALAMRPALTAAGFEVEAPEFGSDGRVPDAEHQRCLRDCDGVLIYWGGATESDTKARIADAEAAVAALRQNKPFGVRGLYVAGPPSSRKATFASRQIDVIMRDPGEAERLAAHLAQNRAKGRRP